MIKRNLFLCPLCLVLALLLLPCSAEVQAEPITPDASGALYILQRCVGLKDAPLLDPELDFSADADRNGTLTSVDALLVLQASVGLGDLEPLPLEYDVKTLPWQGAGSTGAHYTLFHTEFKQWVENQLLYGALTGEQADRLLADYGVEFFQSNALIWAIDGIPTSTEVEVSRLLCAENRFLVTLADGETTDSAPTLHLVLVALSQEALRQTGHFQKMDVGQVLLHRADTIPQPGGALSGVDYPAHFKGNTLVEIGSTQELLSFAAQKKAESDADFARLQQNLIPRNSEDFFRQYRTLVLEIGCLASSQDFYVSWKTEDNADGTKTLVLTLPTAEPPAEPVAPEDEVAHGGIAQRLTFLDLPVKEDSGTITRIRSADGQLLWEATEK